MSIFRDYIHTQQNNCKYKKTVVVAWDGVKPLFFNPFFFLSILFFFGNVVRGILVPQLGLEPGPLALRTLDHQGISS